MEMFAGVGDGCTIAGASLVTVVKCKTCGAIMPKEGVVPCLNGLNRHSWEVKLEDLDDPVLPSQGQ